MQRTFSNQGFNLIEMAVTLLIATILITLSIATFSPDRKLTRLNTTANEMLNILLFAQSTAALQNKYVGVCFFSNSGGERVFAYNPALDTNGVPLQDRCFGNEDILRLYTFDSDVVFCKNCTPLIQHRGIVMYDPQGFTVRVDKSTTPNTVVRHGQQICIIGEGIDEDSKSAREIESSRAGVVELVERNSAGTVIDTIPSDRTIQAGVGNCRASAL
jgi:prepilin-type N-terminal cleavage/methylation domain-containing protein